MTSRSSPLGSANLAASGITRPHCRTHASGTVCLMTVSNALPICGSRCTCWWPSTKSGARPKVSRKLCIWQLISATNVSCSKRRIAACRAVAVSGRKAPSRAGLKLLLRGRNGAVSPRCNPIATCGVTELSVLSEIASEREKLGATTSTEVAFSRPRTTRSRMAMLTEFEMPKSSAHSQMRRRPAVPAAVACVAVIPPPTAPVDRRRLRSRPS